MSCPAENKRGGRIEIICGCMFAGKTAELITRLQAARAAGARVSAFKHLSDIRYGVHVLATHDRRSFAATAVKEPSAILSSALEAEVVGIDEIQFFGSPVVSVCRELAAHGARVIVAGIDHDAWGRPFPPLPELKDLAADVLVLQRPCTVCGRPARYSQRMIPVSERGMVGGPDEYQPRCAECFQALPPPAPTY